MILYFNCGLVLKLNLEFDWQEKFGRHRQHTSKTINDLEMKLSTAEETVNSQKVRIVKLEIENDKLENSGR